MIEFVLRFACFTNIPCGSMGKTIFGPPVNAAIPQIATRKKLKVRLSYIVLSYIHGGNMLYTHAHREKNGRYIMLFT